MKQAFTICVNEQTHTIQCEPDRTLIDVLREDLRLTGTKRGCDIGACGSCTVLIDGKPKRACVVKMKSLVGHETAIKKKVSGLRSQVSGLPQIITIEGLETNGKLHPIQQAFIDCGAIQCGFCTPGMVLTAKALLDEHPTPTREQIKKSLIGNLCRCTGYQQIFEAIETAAKRMKK